MRSKEEWVMPAARYVNAALWRLHLPAIDERKLHQRFTYTRIKKLVPTSLQHLLDEAGTWKPSHGISQTENIYVMWWTGADTMPPLVRLCHENLRRHIHAHNLHLITRENACTLFPSLGNELGTLVRLLKGGNICIQHFSDLLRTLIIVNSGGIWIDATVFVSPDWDNALTGRPFYSGRRTKAYAQSGKSVTNGQWTSYFMASEKGNPLLRFIYEGLKECYLRAEKIEEYYTMDYLFTLAMNCSDEIRRMVGAVPEIDADLFSLEPALDALWDARAFERFMHAAPFFKLNHRVAHPLTDGHGRDTLFGHLCRQYGL